LYHQFPKHHVHVQGNTYLLKFKSVKFKFNDFIVCCICQTTDIGKACMKVFPMSLTDADKATILDVHNNLRRQVAQGTETKGSPGPQPSASNMRQLKWDDELAQMAQTLVQQCVFGHDANRNVGNYICHNFAKSLGMSNSWKLSLAWL
jgi:Cysteine-rich secretory protein family